MSYSEKRGRFHGFSYCYFRNGDRFKLFGSLDEEPGYTIFYYDCATRNLQIKRDSNGVRFTGKYKAFSLYYGEGTENEVFDGWFAALGIKPRTMEKLFGYSSWYNRYEDISIQSIEDDLEATKGILKEGDLFQIDDGWEPTVGDWLEADKNKFPDGMKPICDKIHSYGYKSGLWLAPFAVTAKSRIYKEHKDWLLKHNGDIWADGSNWGGFYSLDLENQEVRKYITEVFDTVLNKWGFDLVKLDFLYAGAPFGDERKTRAAKMIDAMKWLRELCGDKLILGCGVPLMPAFGLVDYCRIGCDVGLDWDDRLYMRIIHRERVSTAHSISNTINRRHLNFRAFLNDPDVFFLREDNLKLNEQQKEYLYTVNALFSGILLTSDNFSSYNADKKKLISRIRKLTSADNVKVYKDRITYDFEGRHLAIGRK